MNTPNNAFCCHMTAHTNCNVIHISVCELTWNFLQTISTEMKQGLPSKQNECWFCFIISHAMTDPVYKIQSLVCSSVTTLDANAAVFFFLHIMLMILTLICFECWTYDFPGEIRIPAPLPFVMCLLHLLLILERNMLLETFQCILNCYVVWNDLIMRLVSEFMITLLVGTVFSMCSIQNKTCCSNGVYVVTAGVVYCCCCMQCGEWAGGFRRQVGWHNVTNSNVPLF
jgi:hypothetical protein